MAMTIPSGADVDDWSAVDLAALGDLDRLVLMAVAYVEQVTGRIPLSEVPDGLAPLAEQAVLMRVEQLAFQAQAESVESSTEEGIRSFSTPGYSETRADGAGKREAGIVNRWAALNDVLWLLMTAEMRDWWSLPTGEFPPAFDVTSVDWSELYSPRRETVETWPGWGAI